MFWYENERTNERMNRIYFFQVNEGAIDILKKYKTPKVEG